MSDLDAWAERKGSRWYGVVRLPWKAKPFHVCECGEVLTFDNELDAFKAASKTALYIFRNQTTGWVEERVGSAQAEWDRLTKRESA